MEKNFFKEPIGATIDAAGKMVTGTSAEAMRVVTGTITGTAQFFGRSIWNLLKRAPLIPAPGKN